MKLVPEDLQIQYEGRIKLF